MANTDHTKQASNRSRRRAGLAVWWAALAVFFIALLYGSFVGLVWWIRSDAKEFAVRTTEDYPGDHVETLLALAQSEGRSFADRDQAVWALGILGDDRALPVLTKFYTGRECDHSTFLCQKELRKAIDRCEGKNWAPGWLPFFPRQPQGIHAGGI